LVTSYLFLGMTSLMTLTNNLALNPAVPPDSPELLALPQRQKVVLVMDLVESVRLMAANELAVVDHWRGFVRHATTHVLPQHQGRMVKSLGDGIMVEFESPRNATNAAVQLHRYFDTANAALPPDQQLYLRAGLNTAQVYIDDIDIYGSGVNLAARVASLAGPGETMVTAEVRDGLTDGLDAKVEDMGECYLKHVAQPVRAFRVGEAGPAPLLIPQSEFAAPLTPTVAVIPFESRTSEPNDWIIGELIADGVIHQLGRSVGMSVLSRLSTSAFRGRSFTLSEMRQKLSSTYVLTGSYIVNGLKTLLNVELAVCATGQVCWTDRFTAEVGDLMELQSEAIHHLSDSVHKVVLQAACSECLIRPMPNLPSYSIMLASVNLMHRQSRQEFKRAHELLEHLSDRHPRLGTPKAWIGKWYALRAAQNWANQPALDLQLAKTAINKALDAEGNHSLALTIKGLIAGYVERDFDAASKSYTAALALNPNEPFAWLYGATLSAWTGDGVNAISSAKKALSLSPIDPIRYYFESLASIAYIAGGDYHGAVGLATESLRRNRAHTSTHKALALSLSLSGNLNLGRSVATEILRLEPSYSVEAFMDRSPLASSPDKQIFALALEAVGIPKS
jgi:adenylate cyclase